MELFLGALAWCAGTGLFVVSLRWLSRANPGEQLPYFGHPTRTPGGAWVLLALALALWFVYFSVWSAIVGDWALGAYGIALILALVLIFRHNRGVRGRTAR